MKIFMMSALLALLFSVGATVAQETAKPKAVEVKPASVEAKEVAVIKTTLGEMVIEFWPDVAPKTVENFKKLSKSGFYDGTAFHRIISGFMIQGGDPLSKDEAKKDRWGTGDPGYKINAEFNPKKHVRGVISMARSASPDSAGCQFFICLEAAPSLDEKYTTFGKLVQGEEVLMKLGRTPTNDRDVPITRANIDSIKIKALDPVK